jgi:hypothetical protein
VFTVSHGDSRSPLPLIVPHNYLYEPQFKVENLRLSKTKRGRLVTVHQVAEVYRVAVSDIERMLRKGSLSFRVRLVIAQATLCL